MKLTNVIIFTNFVFIIGKISPDWISLILLNLGLLLGFWSESAKE